MSIEYGPTWYWGSKVTPAAISADPKSVSSPLGRPPCDRVEDAPWHCREQNLNSASLARFTRTIFPQNSQAIFTRRSSGCLPPAKERRYALRQSTEQNRDRLAWDVVFSYALPHISQVKITHGFLFQGVKPDATRLAVAMRMFSRAAGFDFPICPCLAHVREQYLTVFRAIAVGRPSKVLPHCLQTSCTQSRRFSLDRATPAQAREQYLFLRLGMGTVNSLEQIGQMRARDAVVSFPRVMEVTSPDAIPGAFAALPGVSYDIILPF